MKTVIEMAKAAGICNLNADYWDCTTDHIVALVELVRADEREVCAKVIESHGPFLANGALLVEAIRARGNT